MSLPEFHIGQVHAGGAWPATMAEDSAVPAAGMDRIMIIVSMPVGTERYPAAGECLEPLDAAVL